MLSRAASLLSLSLVLALIGACGDDAPEEPVGTLPDTTVRETDGGRDLEVAPEPDAGAEVSDEPDLGAGEDVPEETGSEDLGGEDDADEPDGYELDVVEDETGTSGPVACDPLPTGYTGTEICGDGLDNDGDGLVDEGCPCALGATQSCFPGDPAQLGVGQCLPGVQICTGGFWGECQGGFVASAEVCDDKDNDCNGCVDDGLVDCVPSFSCPVGDTARPLSWYNLNGPAILDIEGATGWSWTVIPPRNSGTSGPENPYAANTRVYMDVSGDYLISVTATDEKGSAVGCSWIVTAQGEGLRVELTWDTMGRVDVDLHLHRSGTTTDWCHQSDDCYYANCRVYHGANWGYPRSPGDYCGLTVGECPNPRLDIDNIRLLATPENINIDNPNPGDTFRIMVHMYSGDQITTRARVSIYCGGRLMGVFGEAPREAILQNADWGCMGDTWRVADVRMTEDPVTGAGGCLINPLFNESGGWDIRTDTTAF
jgi:hypothetical protein